MNFSHSYFFFADERKRCAKLFESFIYIYISSNWNMEPIRLEFK